MKPTIEEQIEHQGERLVRRENELPIERAILATLRRVVLLEAVAEAALAIVVRRDESDEAWLASLLTRSLNLRDALAALDAANEKA